MRWRTTIRDNWACHPRPSSSRKGQHQFLSLHPAHTCERSKGSRGSISASMEGCTANTGATPHLRRVEVTIKERNTPADPAGRIVCETIEPPSVTPLRVQSSPRSNEARAPFNCPCVAFPGLLLFGCDREPSEPLVRTTTIMSPAQPPLLDR